MPAYACSIGAVVPSALRAVRRVNHGRNTGSPPLNSAARTVPGGRQLRMPAVGRVMCPASPAHAVRAASWSPPAAPSAAQAT